MSDQGQNPPNSNSPSPEPQAPEPAAPAPSLRETIEQSYEQVENETAGQDDRPRDNFGRFVPKGREPGEAEPRAPSPDPRIKETQSRTPEPAPAGSSTQGPPDHWSAEFKADFSKLPPEGQSIFLKRYGEMEADYTRKSQAASGAVGFTNALAPVFNDPVITRSLQEAGLNPMQAIHEWAGMHKRAMSPDPGERVGFLYDLAQRLGFDPARMFAQPGNSSPQGLSPEELKDPAIRYFADHLSRQASEQAALRNTLQNLINNGQAERDQQALQVTKWSIDTFADEKDSHGNLLRPFFDEAIDDIYLLCQAQPDMSMKDAYERAVWSNPATRAKQLALDGKLRQQQTDLERAKAANRGNTRGVTAPVSRPNAPKSGNGTLRDIIEQSAEEVGFTQ